MESTSKSPYLEGLICDVKLLSLRTYLFFALALCVLISVRAQDSIPVWKAQALQLLKDSPDQAIGLLNKGLSKSILLEDEENAAWFSFQKGVLFLRFADTSKGIHYLEKSLDYYAEVSGEKPALVQYHLGIAKKSRMLLEASVQYALDAGDSALAFRGLVARAKLYLHTGDKQKFEAGLDEAFTLLQPSIRMSYAIGPSLVELTRLYLEHGYEKRGKQLLERYSTSSQLNKRALLELRLLLADQMQREGAGTSALSLMDSVYQQLEDVSLKAMVASKIAGLYQEMQAHEQALNYLEKQDSLRTVVRNTGKVNLVRLVEGEYSNKLKAARISELQVGLRRDLYFKAILAFTFLIAVVFAFIINKQINKRRIAKRALLESKKRHEEVAKLILETELEHKKLAEELLIRDIESHRLDLDDFSETFVQHDKVFRHLQSEIDRLKRSTADQDHRAQIGEMQMALRQLTQRDFARKRLLHIKKEVDEEWLFNLQERFPKLTEQDMELLICISAGMQAADIADMYSIEKQSVMTKRYRLRKKLNMDSAQGFEDFFAKEIDT